MARALIIFFDLLVLLHCWPFDYRHTLNIYNLWTGYRYAFLLFSACVLFWIFFILLQKVTKIKPKRTRRGMKHFSAATIPKSRNSLFKNLHTLQVTCCRCWSLSYSTILHSWANSLCSHVIPHEWTTFYSTLLNIHQSGALTVLAWLVPHETAAVSACSVYIIQPCNMSLHAKCEYHSAHSVFRKGCNCSDPMLFWYRRVHIQRILILLTPSERPAQHAYATDSHSTYSFRETSTTSSAGWNPSTLHLKQQPWLLWACHVYAMKSRILKLILVIPVTGLRQAFTSKHSKITAHTSCFHRITVIYHVAITSFVRKSTFWVSWLQ